MNPTTLSMVVEDEFVIEAAVSPENADNKKILWSSDNPDVAKVIEGVVRAISPGKVSIIAKSDDGGKTATCSVTVKEKIYPVEKILLDQKDITLIEGETADLEETILPEKATNKTVIWSSDNQKAATVKDGKVTAVAPGVANITAKTEDGGKTAICKVTVSKKTYSVESVSLDQTKLSLVEGESAVLEEKILPANASNKVVIWSSNMASVALVENGKVIALAPGKTIVTVKTVDGSKTATCEVTVSKKLYAVESVRLNQQNISLVVGNKADLIATVLPSNASNQKVSWSSDNQKVATVQDGKVTAVTPGEANITVKTEDGAKTAICKVSVTAQVYPVESVSLDQTKLSLVEGESAVLKETVLPANATDKSVVWSSSQSAVALVENGKVVALKPGNTIITVKTVDGSKTATCEVTVSKKLYAVESVRLNQQNIQLVVGDNETLTPTVLPSNASNQKVSWSSDNQKVATVQDGKVTAVAPGEANITVKTEDGAKTAVCKVSVTAQVYPVESVSLDQTTLSLIEGESAVLKETVLPSNASNQLVVWSSSMASVALVENGKVVALAPGKTTITVKTVDGSKTATCEVTVSKKVYAVESVRLDQKNVHLIEGETAVLTATVLPSNATNQKVSWTSDNQKVATVIDGTITARFAGEANITATTEDGAKTAICKVTVSEQIYPVESVSLNKTKISLVKGTNTDLVATVLPANASDKSVVWSSSQSSVVLVENGKVYAMAPGMATITVKTVDGSKTATCEVIVTDKVFAVESVQLDQKSVEMVEGGNMTLKATVLPSNATNQNVTWESDNQQVATVTDGLVTAVAPGEANITAKTEDGGKTASCKVTVKEKLHPVESISLNQTKLNLVKESSAQLTETILPANASDKSVIWSSSKTSVALVENGKVFALAPGTATITVKTVDGGKTASCEVTVTDKFYPVESIQLDQKNVNLIVGTDVVLKETVLPSNATNQNVIWSSSDPNVATVENGLVKAIAVGHADITATTEDGAKTAICKVNVTAKIVPVEKVMLNRSTISIEEGKTTRLSATIIPTNASNKKLRWSSSDPTVAIVEAGKIAALTPGKTVITVESEDGEKKATCTMTVTAIYYPVQSVSLSQEKLYLVEGGSASLTAKVFPANASDKSVVWESNNEVVATVKDGVVSALSPGVATITVKTKDGAKTATCTVDVSARIYPVEDIRLNKKYMTLEEGQIETLVASILPTNATNKTVIWSSDNPDVASVEEGRVVAKKPGVANITVKAKDGGRFAECRVTVTKKNTAVKGVVLDHSSLTMMIGDIRTLIATVLPDKAENKNVTWESSNPAVATVENGKVTALSLGETIITVKTVEGGMIATCHIFVKTNKDNESLEEDQSNW